MALKAKDFRKLILEPNLNEYMCEYQLEHRAFNAVAAVDAYAAHIFYEAEEMAIDVCKVLSLAPAACRDDSAFRQALADKCDEFSILRDLAKTNKHARLTRHRPRVSDSGQTSAKSKGWGEERWGEGRWCSSPQVFVQVNGGQEFYVETLVKKSLDVLDGVATDLGLVSGHAD